MKKFTFVEEYLEVIAGYRDPATNIIKNQASLLWLHYEPIISLARYDVSVLESMSESAINGRALTVRQGDLAVKIIMKYQRQLAQKDIDVEPVKTPQWRHALRVMDYSKRLSIADDTIMLEFPFNDKLIDGLREFRKGSQGKGEWNKEKKRWEFALTEYNLSYLVAWTKANEFQVSDDCERLHSLIVATEQIPFAIELDVVDGALTIKNASISLINYINENCGGFSFDNLARLIDMSSLLGYTVSEDIKLAWKEQVGDLQLFLGLNTSVRLPTHRVDLLKSVLNCADFSNRWPVVIYEPDMSGKLLNQLMADRKAEDIYCHKGKTTVDLEKVKGFKYIHTTCAIKNLKMPLLISSAGMLFGGDKSLMVQNSDKRVFFVPEIHLGNTTVDIPLYEDNIDEQKEEQDTR